MKYPNSLQELIEYFKLLPGIGEKNAERLAFAVLKFSDEQVEGFSESLKNVKTKIKKCEICNNLTENDKCDICLDQSRSSDVFCVVENTKNLILFEKANVFNGKYHVLNGLISPIDDIGPEDINIFGLINRIKEMPKVELIIALKPSIEGETTTLYLKKVLEKYPNVKISRLSYGIPMGVDIDYLDELTLLNALSERKNIT